MATQTVAFESDDEVDVDKIFEEFANPYSDSSRPKTALSRASDKAASQRIAQGTSEMLLFDSNVPRT